VKAIDRCSDLAECPMQVPTLCQRERRAGPIAERGEDAEGAIECLGGMAESFSCASGECNRATDVRLGLCDSDPASDQHGLFEDRHGDALVLPD